MIHAKLLAVQRELKAPKNQYNQFGKYKYRSAEDILEALKPVLSQHELTLTLTDRIEMVGDRIYIVAIATLTDGKDTITTTAYAREPEAKKGMDTSQITGASSSYARKYALNGMFLIDDTKDADTQDNSQAMTDELLAQAKKLKTVKELREFYASHRGLGKEFDAEILKLASELKKQEQKTEKQENKEIQNQEIENQEIHLSEPTIEEIDEVINENNNQ